MFMVCSLHSACLHVSLVLLPSDKTREYKFSMRSSSSFEYNIHTCTLFSKSIHIHTHYTLDIYKCIVSERGLLSSLRQKMVHRRFWQLSWSTDI